MMVVSGTLDDFNLLPNPLLTEMPQFCVCMLFVVSVKFWETGRKSVRK